LYTSDLASVGATNGATCVEFEMEKVFKETKNGKIALESHTIMTSNNSAACGVNLNNGVTYLITGRVYEGDNPPKVHVNLCNYVGVWDDITGEVRIGFEGGYQQKCNITNDIR